MLLESALVLCVSKGTQKFQERTDLHALNPKRWNDRAQSVLFTLPYLRKTQYFSDRVQVRL